MINIIIADSHPVVREGFKRIIKDESDLTVVAEASNGNEIIPLLNEHHCDLLILELKMKGRGGIDLITELKSLYPDLLILVATIYPEQSYGYRVLKLGASGYITKDRTPKDLIKAIRTILQRGKYVSQELALVLAEELEESDSNEAPHERLSERELQVMLLIADGLQVSEIAEKLSISTSTVNTYRARILEKTNLDSNVAIAHYALQNKLIK